MKFRLYTKLTLQAGGVAAVITLAIVGGWPGPAVGIVICGLATVIALEYQPALATRTHPRLFQQWGVAFAVAVLVIVWLASAIVANLSSVDSATKAAGSVGTAAVILGTFCILPFMRHCWPILIGISILTGFALDAPSGSGLISTAVTLLIGAFIVSTTQMTLWGLQIVDDLERAKNLGAELQIAEERLRFGRDLHDVVGRNFSTIAVKSELAVTLSRAGSAERAAAEMDEVKTIAVESMNEMRQLVRGYRDINLQSEVAGARSLLSATGCTLLLEGEPATVPAQLHELAAWVVREGTTNIVRHSSARSATLALGPTGMSLRNDGATGTPRARSGLLGLSQRLAAGGATLDTTVDGDTFTLEIRWEKP